MQRYIFFNGNYVHVFKLKYFFDSIVNVICTTTGTMPNHKMNTVKTPIQQKRTKKNVISKIVFWLFVINSFSTDEEK